MKAQYRTILMAKILFLDSWLKMHWNALLNYHNTELFFFRMEDSPFKRRQPPKAFVPKKYALYLSV